MRTAVAGIVLGLAVVVGVPTTWYLTRPPATAGPPLSEALPGTEAPAGVPSASAVPSPPAPLPEPVRLRVPALGVDTTVDPVGIAPDGQMEIPDDVARVGWYRFGPQPGMPGSAVLAGHVDDRVQGLGALARLREAEVGQEVVVTDSAGTDNRWRVVTRSLISKQVLPVAELFARDGPPRLTLITCGGPFLPRYGSYRDNVVVVAEPAR